MNKFTKELKSLYPGLNRPYKVMIAGTFDIIHTGHTYLIQKAAEIGDLYVIIARDISVEKFKGQKPIMPEAQRMELIRNIKGVKYVELGSDTEDWLKRIIEINPDLFLLGPNQWGDENSYEKEVKKKGAYTIFRRLPTKDIRFSLNSSTKIKEKILKVYKSVRKD
ncbi:MAG: adenylyltransferase/cytidyltransferase family protein [Candidatus Lokiarchaeota archaeon]|nr:adenylyltransferase/cytidyltransferase family protein [Candidatus Lokiarchaeota archaeon]